MKLKCECGNTKTFIKEINYYKTWVDGDGQMVWKAMPDEPDVIYFCTKCEEQVEPTETTKH